MKVALRVGIAAVIAISASVPAVAATFCAKNSHGPQVIFVVAQANGDGDVIQLGWNTFMPSFAVRSDDVNSLTTAGGIFISPGFQPHAFQASVARLSKPDDGGAKALLDIHAPSAESRLAVGNLMGIPLGTAFI